VLIAFIWLFNNGSHKLYSIKIAAYHSPKDSIHQKPPVYLLKDCLLKDYLLSKF